MSQTARIFDTHFQDYCRKIADCALPELAGRLKIEVTEDEARIPLFNKIYTVSGSGVVDDAGQKPDYGICVILFRYLLNCPDRIHEDPAWVSFKDFKKASHFTNVNFFTSDTLTVLLNRFRDRPGLLEDCGLALGGWKAEEALPYDLSLRFTALPRIDLLLLFNGSDEDFPAQCTLLFQAHAQHYLDPEALAMTSAHLARKLTRRAG